MSIWQLLAILWARRHIAFLVAATTILVAAVTLALLPRRYDATAQLFVNLSERNQATNEQLSFAAARDFIETQIEFGKTQAVAERVVDDLKLASDPEERAAIARNLLGGLDISRVGGTSIISVIYHASSPEEAVRLANAFAAAHVAKDLETRILPARESLMWYGQRMAEIQQKLAQAQTRRSELQRLSGAPINATGPAEDVQIAAARLEVIQAKVALDQLKQDQVAQVNRGDRTEALRKRIADIDLRITTETRIHRLGSEHSLVRNLNDIRRALVQQLADAQGTDRADEISKADFRLSAAQRRYSALVGLSDDDLERAHNESEPRVKLAMLNREVDALQKQSQDLIQRREQLRLESEINRTPISQLTVASATRGASFPKVGRTLSIAIVMGITIGVCLAFLREMLDRRIRCAEDAQALGLPLLAIVPSARIVPRFHKRELGDPTPPPRLAAAG